MNTNQLRKLGIPDDAINTAIQAIQQAAKLGLLREMDVKKTLRELAAAPESFVDDGLFGALAREIVDLGGPVEDAARWSFALGEPRASTRRRSSKCATRAPCRTSRPAR